jgi:hypothetical protein
MYPREINSLRTTQPLKKGKKCQIREKIPPLLLREAQEKQAVSQRPMASPPEEKPVQKGKDVVRDWHPLQEEKRESSVP